MLKQAVTLVLASIIALFFLPYIHFALTGLANLQHWAAHNLIPVANPVAYYIKYVIILCILPLVLGSIVLGIMRLIDRVYMAYVVYLIWAVWLISLVVFVFSR